VSQQTTNRSFDDLARALAEGSISRRRALKLFAGTALAALIPSRALADDDDCVRVCHVPFNRETEECDFANAETRCVSRSRRRVHLDEHPCDCRGRCANCLTSCLPIADTCSANDQCCSGRCASGLEDGGTCAEPCPSDRPVLLSNGSCVRIGSGVTCDCPAGCFCQHDEADPTGSRVFCWSSTGFTSCPNGHSDCPEGEFCGGNPGNGFCYTVC
jgi:hypothetical protein